MTSVSLAGGSLVTAIFAVALEGEVELEFPEAEPGVALEFLAASCSAFSFFSLRHSDFLWPFFLQ